MFFLSATVCRRMQYFQVFLKTWKPFCAPKILWVNAKNEQVQKFKAYLNLRRLKNFPPSARQSARAMEARRAKLSATRRPRFHERTTRTASSGAGMLDFGLSRDQWRCSRDINRILLKLPLNEGGFLIYCRKRKQKRWKVHPSCVQNPQRCPYIGGWGQKQHIIAHCLRLLGLATLSMSGLFSASH